jgi:hypothetical protein
LILNRKINNQKWPYGLDIPCCSFYVPSLFGESAMTRICREDIQGQGAILTRIRARPMANADPVSSGRPGRRRREARSECKGAHWPGSTPEPVRLPQLRIELGGIAKALALIGRRSRGARLLL